MTELPFNLASLLNKWSPVIYRSVHIWTWTEPVVLAWLAELASKSKFAVESGVYLGRSSKVMLDASPNLHLWSVDPGMVAGVFETSQYFLRKEISEGRCEMIRGNSEKAGEMLQHMKGKIDLVFVDDGHATEDVKRDIRCLLPLVRSGGVICGHDFEVPYNDVALGVAASLPKWEVPAPRFWMHTKP
jgi:predicted O-methyltransferase YrrM